MKNETEINNGTKSVVYFALFFYSVFVWGLLTMKFWKWFFIPIFPELPELNYLYAVGLYLFLTIVRGVSSLNSDDDTIKEFTTKVTTLILLPWVALILGWIVHLLIN